MILRYHTDLSINQSHIVLEPNGQRGSIVCTGAHTKDTPHGRKPRPQTAKSVQLLPDVFLFTLSYAGTSPSWHDDPGRAGAAHGHHTWSRIIASIRRFGLHAAKPRLVESPQRVALGPSSNKPFITTWACIGVHTWRFGQLACNRVRHIKHCFRTKGLSRCDRLFPPTTSGFRATRC